MKLYDIVFESRGIEFIGPDRDVTDINTLEKCIQ